jgi:3-dehydroquinate dehydratase-2
VNGPPSAASGRALRILCISGPNLQLLGTREPAIYGTATLQQIYERISLRASELGVTLDCRQTNHEGAIVDMIGGALGTVDGILLNAGAFTHTSIAILDALKAVRVPCVEVHLSNPDAREGFRRRSRMAAACVGRVAGFGADSYLLALEGLVKLLSR